MNRSANPLFIRQRRWIMTLLFALPGIVLGHAGEKHDDQGIAVDNVSTEKTNSPLPIDVGGPFSLTDHHGNAVTDQTFAGKHMLVFFGYTNCQIMCSISLTRIGEALKILETENNDLLANLTPIIVTVDPQNDSPAQLKKSLAQYHSALLGLTGTPENLDQIYQAYNQSPVVLDETLNDKDIVSHASYFHLMGPDGELQTLFPPILNAESMAGILKKYIL